MISNSLDSSHYRIRLRERSRVQVPDFLQESAAATLRKCLITEVPWQTATRTDRPLLFEGGGDTEQAAALKLLYQRAESGFEFVFDRYRMIEARRDGLDPGLILHVVVDFLNSPDFIGFARELTGDPKIAMTSAIAVRYRKGHFLNPHTDHSNEEGRAFAYVINLSKEWQPNWGGVLQFIDEDRNVVESFNPHWNSLSLFRVPQTHQVSLIAPWAGEDRYSITGWFLHF